MRFAFDEDQEALRESARAFLAEHSSPERVRQAMASEAGFDPEVWKRIGAELGWPSVIVPEAYGGLGLGCVELVALVEEMGASLLCSPFFATVCLGTQAVLAAASDEQKAELLPVIAAGERTATLALSEERAGWDASRIATTWRREGREYVLGGTKRYVPDGHTADLLVVAARGEPGPLALFAVPGDAAGVSRTPLPTQDPTRRQARVALDGVRVPASARLGDGDGDGEPAIARALDLAAVALAAEQVGGADRCLAMAVSYARERVQFGRPIGSFQAIKHKCADMLLRVESARSACYYAAWVAAEGDPGELPAAASLAKAYCSDAYFHCAAESLQIHGGVGFTWEYDVHLYLKRARSGEVLLGDAAWHRERVARLMGLDEPAEMP